MQTMPPMDKAVTKYGGAVQPIARKIRQVSSNVAIIMPEVGQEDEPTSPVRRDETRTKRKPNATIRIAPNKLNRRFNCGAIIITMSKTIIALRNDFIDKSWSVRGKVSRTAPDARRSANPLVNTCQMSGIEVKSVIVPAA